MNLQVAARDRRKEHPTGHRAEVVNQLDRVVIEQSQLRRVIRIDEHRITVRTGQRVHLGVDQRVELLATSRADDEFAVARLGGRHVDNAEMSLAVGGLKLSIGAQVPSAVLKLIARLFELLDALIERHHAGDLFADRLTGFALEQRRLVRTRGHGEVA